MRRAATLWGSTVGKKIVMAVTGLILLLFVFGHAVGNLKVYNGEAAYNHYAAELRVVGAPLFAHAQLLWLVRVILGISLVLHVWAGVTLTLRKWRMREHGYRKFDFIGFAWASRTMFWGGLAIFGFVVFHLLDLTFGDANPNFISGSVYHNVIASFQRWPASAGYMVAMIFLGLHLYHGFWSMFQTMGWNNARYNAYRRPLAALIALAIFLVNISFPLGVLTGIIHR